MSSIRAIHWLLLFTAKLVVAPPTTLPLFDFRPACYDTDRESLPTLHVEPSIDRPKISADHTAKRWEFDLLREMLAWGC